MTIKYRVTLLAFFSSILYSILIAFLASFLNTGNSILTIIALFVAGMLSYKAVHTLSKSILNYNAEQDIGKWQQVVLILGYAVVYYLTVLISSGNFLLASFMATFVSTVLAYKTWGKMFDNREVKETITPNGAQKKIRPDNIKDKFTFTQRNNGDTVIPTGDKDGTIQDTIHGSAMWISDKDKEYLTDSFDEQKTFRGLWIGGGFFHHKEGNLVSIAPPGKGKGAALIIPNLLWKRKYNHSFVIFDPKGTNACITARFQKEAGQKVIIIDPLGVQQQNKANHNIQPASFNPLDFIRDDIYNGAGMIANLFLPDEPENKNDKFWINKARDLFQGVLMHIVTSAKYKENERNLVTLYRTIRGNNFEELFMDMSENDDSAVGEEISLISEEFDNLRVNGNTTFVSIVSTITNSILWLGNPQIQSAVKSSSFNPDEIAEGGITLYLCQPIQNREQFSIFSRLVVGIILRRNAKPTSQSKAWVYYLLDEFPSMGIFPEIITYLALAREYKMRLWIFAQSLSQLDTVYGQTVRETIIGTSNVLQAFGITDRLTQEYISSRIGNTTIVQENITKSETRSKMGDTYSQDYRTDKNKERHGRLLIMPEELEREPNIVTLTEWGPMRLNKWQYWQHHFDNVSKYYYGVFNDGRADKNPNFQ